MKITLHLLKLSQKLGWVPVFWPTRYRAKQSSHCKKIRDLKSPKYTDRSIHNTCQETVDDGKVWSHTIAIGSIFLCWHAKTFSMESSTVKSTAMKLHNTIMRLHVLSASFISHRRFLQLTFLCYCIHFFSKFLVNATQNRYARYTAWIDNFSENVSNIQYKTQSVHHGWYTQLLWIRVSKTWKFCN